MGNGMVTGAEETHATPLNVYPFGHDVVGAGVVGAGVVEVVGVVGAGVVEGVTGVEVNGVENSFHAKYPTIAMTTITIPITIINDADGPVAPVGGPIAPVGGPIVPYPPELTGFIGPYWPYPGGPY